MVASKFIVGGALVATASASVHPIMAALRARVDLSPGSPAYNCHDNCGMFFFIVLTMTI